MNLLLIHEHVMHLCDSLIQNFTDVMREATYFQEMCELYLDDEGLDQKHYAFKINDILLIELFVDNYFSLKCLCIARIEVVDAKLNSILLFFISLFSIDHNLSIFIPDIFWLYHHWVFRKRLRLVVHLEESNAKRNLEAFFGFFNVTLYL